MSASFLIAGASLCGGYVRTEQIQQQCDAECNLAAWAVVFPHRELKVASNLNTQSCCLLFLLEDSL